MTELSLKLKKGWGKRFFAFALTLCMLFSVTNIPVFAATEISNVIASTPANGSSPTNGSFETGDTFSKNKLQYEVTGKSTVAFTGTTSTASKVTIPATVSANGVKYKVTAISSNALKNNKTVKTIVVGTNVKKIGANAFSGCTKLKTLQFKTSKLTDDNLSAKTFTGVKKSVTVKVPSKKLNAYKSIFRSNGLLTSVTIKKN